MKTVTQKIKMLVARFRPIKAMHVLVFLLLVASFATVATATEPNPGHLWTEIGDGVIAFTGPTVLHTFTLPNYDSTILTSNSFAKGDIVYGSAASTTAQLAIGSLGGFLSVSSGGIPAWVATSTLNVALSNTTGILGVAQGGTGLATLTASNVILGNGASAPTFVAPGTSGNVLTSNGSTWASTAPAVATTTVQLDTPMDLSTGAAAATAVSSLTTFNVGLFNLPQSIIVNKMSYNIGTVTTAGTYKVCVYNEGGDTKLIDATSNTNTSGTNTITLGAPVTLPAGNYYLAMGCATTCSNTVSLWTTTSVTMMITPPTGKKVSSGTDTMSSGTCNTPLPTISGAISKLPVVRFDY